MNPEAWIDKGKQEPTEFTDELSIEKEVLIAEGFPGWKKNDYNIFIKLCELHGRNNFDRFGELFKPIDEIKRYSVVFWEKHTQIKNSQKHLERIEKGEAEIAKRTSIDKAITHKFI